MQGSRAACAAQPRARRTQGGRSKLPRDGWPDCSEIAYAAASGRPCATGLCKCQRVCSLMLSAPIRGRSASLRRSSGRPNPASEAPSRHPGRPGGLRCNALWPTVEAFAVQAVWRGWKRARGAHAAVGDSAPDKWRESERRLRDQVGLATNGTSSNIFS